MLLSQHNNAHDTNPQREQGSQPRHNGEDSSPQRQQGSQPRRAVVILAVLMVVIVLALIGYQYLDLMTQEYRAAENVYRTAQSKHLAESGVYFVASVLGNAASYEQLLGSNPFDNPQMFSGQVVSVNEITGQQGMFSVVAPLQIPGQLPQGGIRFGVTDESGKINLNALMKLDKKGDTLLKILKRLMVDLNLSENIASEIVDWLDEDGETREGGAEDDIYMALDPPYHCKNGPIESLDELLMVRSIDSQILYGNDLNRNGMIDANEKQNDPKLDLGLAAYLTIYSREQNITKDFKLRINLNEKDLAKLHEKLTVAVGPELANYIILARQNGASPLPDSTDGSSGGSGKSSSGSAGSGSSGLADVQLDLSKQGKKKIGSMFDLINSQVTVSGSKGSSSTVYASPLNEVSGQEELLPLLFDMTSVTKDSDIPARININAASDPVLRCMSDATEEEAQEIIDARPTPELKGTPAYQTPAWLMLQAKLKPDVAKKLEKYVTTHSQVYRVQVIGHFSQGGAFTRVEAVIDINGGRPRILHYRDLSVLGKGYALPTADVQR